jgi:hypothetical protein
LRNSGDRCRVYTPYQKTRDSCFPLALQIAAERVAFVVEC